IRDRKGSAAAATGAGRPQMRALCWPARSVAAAMTAHQSRIYAPLMMLIAVATFAFMDAGLKELAGTYPAMQVAALRGASSLPFILVWVVATSGLRPLLRVRWPLHVLRGAIGIAMMASFA